MNFVRMLSYSIFLVLWILGIVYLSLVSNPNQKIPLYGTVGGNLLHLLAFFVLFFLFYLLFSFITKKLFYAMVLSFVFSLGISIFKEFLQISRTTRDFSFLDIGFDEIGVIISALLVGICYLMIKKKRDPNLI